MRKSWLGNEEATAISFWPLAIDEANTKKMKDFFNVGFVNGFQLVKYFSKTSKLLGINFCVFRSENIRQ